MRDSVLLAEPNPPASPFGRFSVEFLYTFSSQVKVDFSRSRFDPNAQKEIQSALKKAGSSAPHFQLDETHVKRKVYFRRSAPVTHITQLQKRTTQIPKVQAR